MGKGTACPMESCFIGVSRACLCPCVSSWLCTPCQSPRLPHPSRVGAAEFWAFPGNAASHPTSTTLPHPHPHSLHPPPTSNWESAVTVSHQFFPALNPIHSDYAFDYRPINTTSSAHNPFSSDVLPGRSRDEGLNTGADLVELNG